MFADRFEAEAPTIRIDRRLGSVLIWESDGPSLFVVKASGYVGPSLISEELQRAKEFGKRHPTGWMYLVDTSEVRAVNPLNLLLLRRIPALPNIRRYVIVAPRCSRRSPIPPGAT